MDKEKVREAASAHYEGLAEDKKQMARRLFKAMDTDKSGNASIDEFIAFRSYIALQSDNHYCLFAQLDKDNNGTLDFMELVTFFYILNHDEYKNLLNSQPCTDVPHWKGQSSNWNEIVNLFASGIQIGQFLDQTGCFIV